MFSLLMTVVEFEGCQAERVLPGSDSGAGSLLQEMHWPSMCMSLHGAMRGLHVGQPASQSTGTALGASWSLTQSPGL